MTLDHTKPCRTTDGTPADFVCDDKHRLYPLSFTVAGRILSYTREGRYEMSGAHPLDLYNDGRLPRRPLLRPGGVRVLRPPVGPRRPGPAVVQARGADRRSDARP